MRRLAASAVALAFLTAVACTKDTTSSGGASPSPSTFALQVATSDLYAGTAQRVQVGGKAVGRGQGVRVVAAEGGAPM